MGCTSLTVHTIFFLDTSLNRSPVDENVSFTVLSPNFNESIPMTMETNPAYISASLPIRVMRIFLKTYIKSIICASARLINLFNTFMYLSA